MIYLDAKPDVKRLIEQFGVSNILLAMLSLHNDNVNPRLTADAYPGAPITGEDVDAIMRGINHKTLGDE